MRNPKLPEPCKNVIRSGCRLPACMTFGWSPKLPEPCERQRTSYHTWMNPSYHSQESATLRTFPSTPPDPETSQKLPWLGAVLNTEAFPAKASHTSHGPRGTRSCPSLASGKERQGTQICSSLCEQQRTSRNPNLLEPCERQRTSRSGC